jgi:hypothetical protein
MIIFLDIDGVLNQRQDFKDLRAPEDALLADRYHAWLLEERQGESIFASNQQRVEYRLTSRELAWQLTKLNKTCVAYVAKLIMACQAVVVLWSSWRTSVHWETLDKFLTTYYQAAGWEPCLIGQTPWLYPPARRGDEIRQWLEEHSSVVEYRIIDDMPPCQFPGQETYLWQTRSDSGITLADFERFMQQIEPMRPSPTAR